GRAQDSFGERARAGRERAGRQAHRDAVDGGAPPRSRAQPSDGTHLQSRGCRVMKSVQQLHERRSRLVGNGEITVSFEFFPPKTERMEEPLWTAIRRLEPLAPEFVSVTYGAGGSTRERTHATVARIVKETSLAPAAHLTCVGATC